MAAAAVAAVEVEAVAVAAADVGRHQAFVDVLAVAVDELENENILNN